MMDIRRQFLILIMISSFLSIFCSLCLGNKSINVKSSSSVNLSIKKSFLNDRLRLSLDGYDIFNGDRNRACRQIYNVRSSFNTKYETRKVGLTLTYRFHKIKERENQTSAEVEMKRLGISEE